MRLQTKTLILAGFMWAALLIVPNTRILDYSMAAYAALSLALSMLVFLFIRRLFIKRIEKINSSLSEMTNSNKLSLHLGVDGNDEIALAASQMNLLIDSINKVKHEQEKHSKDYLQKLQTKNDELQKEIQQLLAVEKKISVHQDEIAQPAQNREFFNESLSKAMVHTKRHQKILAVLVINLDFFKQINLRFGRDAGDLVLKEIGERFVNTLRTDDMLTRLEGDEFVVLLNDIGKPKFASAVAEKLQNSCAKPIKINTHEVTVKTSIGICIYPSDGDSLESLLTNAKTALDAAKRAGGGDYKFYSKEMNAEGHEYIQLEKALRQAILHNELSLYYQPKLDIKQSKIVGIEALTRWAHPEFGNVNPAVFIALAEETNLIISIGEWTLKEACKMNKYWQDEGYNHLIVSVNLSPKQFYHPDVVNMISSVLNETGLSPHYLEIEINEATIMTNMEQATDILNSIKAIGVQIAMDHFGVGYTSISHLKQLPLSTMKIDQSFIKGIPHNSNDLAITNAFISLAHYFGLKVIAEGVETAEQVQYLADQQCDMVQGYYYSPPMSAENLKEQLTRIMDEVLI